MSEHRISVNVASHVERAACTMPRCAQDTWAASRAGLTCGRPRRQKHQEGDNIESHGIHIDLRCADGAAGGRRAQSPGPRRRRGDYVCRNSLLPVERKKGDKLNFAGKSRAPLFRSFFQQAVCISSCLAWPARLWRERQQAVRWGKTSRLGFLSFNFSRGFLSLGSHRPLFNASSHYSMQPPEEFCCSENGFLYSPPPRAASGGSGRRRWGST